MLTYASATMSYALEIRSTSNAKPIIPTLSLLARSGDAMRNYQSNYTTRESNASLYRTQNASVLGALVGLVAFAAIVLAIVVLASTIGLF